MTNTANLGLPLIIAAQAQKHVTHNEALRALDAIVQLSVLDTSLTDPPPSPGEGDRYIVAAPATGAWNGHEDAVAAFQDGAWMFYQPQEGWSAWVVATSSLVVFDGTAWQSGAGGVNPAPFVGINTTADATNRLAVKSDAVLFSHDDVTPGNGSLQHKLNKKAGADTASLLYQTGFSGRAELGLAGDDDFRVKVSADGSVWRDAMIINNLTGVVSCPATPGASALPNLLINGSFQINQRDFLGGSVSPNAFCFDRWRAGASGADVSVSGHQVTLTSGTLRQTIEPAIWDMASLASATFSISVENPSADINVSLGSATATIVAGSGRQGALLVTGAGDVGNLDLSISGSAPATFSRIALHHAGQEVPYLARPTFEEEALCRAYFERIKVESTGAVFVSVIGARSPTVATGVIPYQMKRSLPVFTTSPKTDFDVLGLGGEVISSITFTAAGRSLSEITVVLSSGAMVTGGAYQLKMALGGFIDINAEL